MIKRKSTIMLLAVAGLMLAAGAAQAALIEKDSADFGNKYEADAVPGAPDFTLGGSSSFTSSAGVLSYSTNDAETCYFDANSSFFNPAAGTDFTVEASFQVSSGSTQFVVSGGNHHAYINVSTYSISILNSTFSVTDLTNGDALHTYRVAYTAANDRFNLWRDGVLIGENIDAWHSAYVPHMSFGDRGAGYGGNVSLDYLRADTTGAYAPVVPEPATMCLLAVGGLAALRRRRK